MTRHGPCAGLVLLVGGRVLNPDGDDHVCPDYMAWYQLPDRRDPAVLDVPGGWRPAAKALARTA